MNIIKTNTYMKIVEELINQLKDLPIELGEKEHTIRREFGNSLLRWARPKLDFKKLVDSEGDTYYMAEFKGFKFIIYYEYGSNTHTYVHYGYGNANNSIKSRQDPDNHGAIFDSLDAAKYACYNKMYEILRNLLIDEYLSEN